MIRLKKERDNGRKLASLFLILVIWTIVSSINMYHLIEEDSYEQNQELQRQQQQQTIPSKLLAESGLDETQRVLDNIEPLRRKNIKKREFGKNQDGREKLSFALSEDHREKKKKPKKWKRENRNPEMNERDSLQIPEMAMRGGLWGHRRGEQEKPPNDTKVLEQRRKRHEYNEKNNQQQRIVLFVHFHKAGGSSMVSKFRESGYQLWDGEANGNPVGLPPGDRQFLNLRKRKPFRNLVNGEEVELPTYCSPPRRSELLRFWEYSPAQFEGFLEDARNQTYRIAECKQREPVGPRNRKFAPRRNVNTNVNPKVSPDFEHAKAHPGAEFISLEWNFFAPQHFNEDASYFRNRNIDIVTILRDPYDRFVSNFHFRPDSPSGFKGDIAEWALLDLERRDLYRSSVKRPSSKRSHENRTRGTQYGEALTYQTALSVNYNKPNYYTAFLNGMANNHDDFNTTNNIEYENNYGFDYFAFGLNQTHLEIAKKRLREVIDVILILEYPETHVMLDPWFEFLGTEKGSDNLPHQNKRRRKQGDKRNMLPSEKEFYKFNALDKELYDYAVELALSRIKS